jgi:hypothetical protein
MLNNADTHTHKGFRRVTIFMSFKLSFAKRLVAFLNHRRSMVHIYEYSRSATVHYTNRQQTDIYPGHQGVSKPTNN